MSRWIFKMSSCGSNAGMETSAPLINATSIRFDSNSHIHLKPFTSCAFFWWTRFRFCNEMCWGQNCSVARNLEVHTGLLHCCTFRLHGGCEWGTGCQGDTARTRPACLVLHNNQQTSSWSVTLMLVVGYGMRQTQIWPTEFWRQLDYPAQQQQGAGSNHWLFWQQMSSAASRRCPCCPEFSICHLLWSCCLQLPNQSDLD